MAQSTAFLLSLSGKEILDFLGNKKQLRHCTHRRRIRKFDGEGRLLKISVQHDLMEHGGLTCVCSQLKYRFLWKIKEQIYLNMTKPNDTFLEKVQYRTSLCSEKVKQEELKCCLSSSISYSLTRATWQFILKQPECFSRP